jgi:hypothetical protein
MPQMPYPKVVAFVEGDMEQLFINNNFSYVRVVSVSNGTGWSTDALAGQIETFYGAEDYHDWWIIVWIDRERREEGSLEIEQVIRTRLEGAGAPAAQIKVLVADRMSENVILADSKFMASEFGDMSYGYGALGKGGKHILKEMYKKLSINYKETRHGVAALKRIRLWRSAQNCPAVHRFVSTNPISCWWIDDDNEP